jgi:hypothetical protein
LALRWWRVVGHEVVPQVRVGQNEVADLGVSALLSGAELLMEEIAAHSQPCALASQRLELVRRQKRTCATEALVELHIFGIQPRFFHIWLTWTLELVFETTEDTLDLDWAVLGYERTDLGIGLFGIGATQADRFDQCAHQPAAPLDDALALFSLRILLLRRLACAHRRLFFPRQSVAA